MTASLDPKPNPWYPTLVLASQSPRRARLLSEAGYVFTQQSPPFADPDQPPEWVPEVTGLADETGSPMSGAERYAADLARQKAVSLVPHVAGPAVVLAADTLCVTTGGGSPGKLIGKPRDRADAKRMLRGFMDREHAVVSGVALLAINEGTGNHSPTLLADTAVVAFGNLPDADLQRYLDTDDWRGKAGGYNLFDRQQAGWPITVEGDPTTVVGLPMVKLDTALEHFGIIPGR